MLIIAAMYWMAALISAPAGVYVLISITLAFKILGIFIKPIVKACIED